LLLDEAWLEAETQRAVEAAQPGEDVWDELQALHQEIKESWQSDKTAAELVSEQRR
jgi:hypothetical protein